MTLSLQLVCCTQLYFLEGRVPQRYCEESSSLTIQPPTQEIILSAKHPVIVVVTFLGLCDIYTMLCTIHVSDFTVLLQTDMNGIASM